jgi:DNA-binding NtrC family response regulator
MKIEQWNCPVLIVDDDNDLCGLIEMMVKKVCPVHVEHDLHSAGGYLSSQKPAIIFLDNSLPDGKGILFIKTILSVYPDAKIVLMTADQVAGLKEAAMGEGAVDFISKPFRASAIVEMILLICPELNAA